MITGAKGQLGNRLVEKLNQRSGLEAISLNRIDLDISDENSVRKALDKWAPDGVINAAAYTAVDQAEDETELAFSVNFQGVEHLAKGCAKKQIPFIHLSTDYVFDGSNSSPYKASQTPNPMGVYGASKLAGEEAVQAAFHDHNNPTKFWIFRVGWLYDSVGKNFLTTMLKLGRKGEELRVVSDQWGSPTAAGPLASMLVDCMENPDCLPSGIWHYGTEGPTHWYAFAQAIFQLSSLEVDVQPCKSSEYPTKARRPAYSYLDPKPLMQALGKPVIPWREELQNCLLDHAN